MKKRTWHRFLGALLLLWGCEKSPVLNTSAPICPRSFPSIASVTHAENDLIARALDLAGALLTLDPYHFPHARKAYTSFLGRTGQLVLFDPELQDLLVYPGAGNGIVFPLEVAPEHFFFIRNFKIWLYDATRERTTLLSGTLPEGRVVQAAPDAYSNIFCLVAFGPLASPTRKLFRIRAAYSAFLPRAWELLASASVLLEGEPPELPDCSWPPLLGSEELTEVNRVGATHGGLQTFFSSAQGFPLVFTTEDGGLYWYDPPHLCKLDTLGKRAAFPVIDAVLARWVAWEDRPNKRIYVHDLRTAEIDPVPFANLVVPRGATLVDVLPLFYRADAVHLYVFAVFSDQTYQVFLYDRLTEENQTLTLINTLAEGESCKDLGGASPSAEPPSPMFQELFGDQ